MSLDVNDTFPGNVTSISWSPPNTGSADYYIITYSDVQTSNVFKNETSDKTSYELTVEFGSKYTIEVFSVFGGYKNAEAAYGVTTTCKFYH